MATRKVTFTFDQSTVDTLDRTAARVGKPKSQVVREAIHDYAERVGRLSERERLKMLRTFDEFVERIPERPLREVDAEIEDIRRLRRGGGRRSAKPASGRSKR